MAEFRHLHVDNNELLKTVFTAQTNPLISIDGEVGNTYYKKIEDKLEYLYSKERHAIILFVWEGKYATDVFELSEDDIQRITSLFSLTLKVSLT